MRREGIRLSSVSGPDGRQGETMRIKLINPRMNCRPSDTRLKFKLLPPQSLLLLGGLVPARHHVELVDENIEDDDGADAGIRPDLVAMPIFVATAKRGYELARKYRARGVPVVLGGLHVTALPDEAARHADAVVVGEAERVWPQLLVDVEAGRLQPRYRDTGTVPLELVPFLRRELARRDAYASVAALRASRGCPYRCDFCYQSSFYPRRGVRSQPVDRIVAEVRALGERHILLLDDNLIGDRAFARRLFRALAPLGITWSGAADIQVGADPELLDLAWTSGCRSLFIGFESIGQENLRNHGKSQNRVDRFSAQVDAIHRRGIMVNGSFVFGMDHDGPGVFEETVAWIVRHRVETATFHILTPYPGTPLFARLEAEGRIIDRDWDHYNTAHAVFRPARMSVEELEAGYRWAYRSVYSWDNVWARAPVVPSLKLPYWGFVLGYKKLAPVTQLLNKLGLFRSMFSLCARLCLERGAGASVYSDGAAALTSNIAA
jgi:radical SAM superfamily enzyme YgiQ (UPF0313 family)